jgi:hypothetical protein
MRADSILDFMISQCDKNSNDTAWRGLALKWLNLILKDIQSRQESFHWRFLEVLGATFNTAAADYDYAFATILPTTLIDTTKTIHVYQKTDDITLTFIPYERFRQKVADETEDSGTPRWYSIYANNLLLWPIPDSVVVAHYIDYIKLITAATDSSTTLDIPDKYEKVIIDGMLEYAYMLEPEKGNRAEQHLIYEDGILKMKQENQQIIAENVLPVSHRERHNAGDADSQNSSVFPLDNANI